MKAYYGSRVSNHMTLTPEGFLICHDVPISRLGSQDYLKSEVDGGNSDNIIEVFRTEQEVFDPKSLASFEGKPVTSPHPIDGEVRPDNAAALVKGHAQNIRRGTGNDSDKVIADLHITDPVLIAEIQAGKREVSCGYRCDVVSDNGQYKQVTIRGNHIAIVADGRAGESVSIKDQKPERKTKKMAKRRKKGNALVDALSRFFKDEDTTTDDVAEVIEEILGDEEVTDNEPTQDNESTIDNDLAMKVDSLTTDVSALTDNIGKIMDMLQNGTTDSDPIEALVQELVGDNESASTLSDEETNDEDTFDNDGTLDEETYDEDTLDDDVLSDNDLVDSETIDQIQNDANIRLLRGIKPAIAKLPPKQKKMVTDAISRTIRTGKKKKTNGYSNLQRIADSNTRKHKAQMPDLKKMESAYAQRNPHSKEYRNGGR